MKIERYIMAGSYFICLLLIPLVSGCKKDSSKTPDDAPDLGSVPHSDWMGQLDSLSGGLTLGELTIPGSHISGADLYHVDDLDEEYVTQAYKISDQLELGIRFLDIRVGYDTNDCATGLGLYSDEINHTFMNDDVYLNQSFQSVISSIDAFLHENPTEMVIILVRQVHSSIDLIDFWGMVTAEIANGGFSSERIVDYDPTSDTRLPLLSACRNKLLFMSTQPTTGFEGFTFSWPDNTSGYSEWVGHLHGNVQDMAKWDCLDLNQKAGYVNQMIDQCRTVPKASQPENLFINFTSAWDICSDREEIAGIMNIATFNYLMGKATNANPCGILVMDFAGDMETSPAPLVEWLIAINFIQR